MPKNIVLCGPEDLLGRAMELFLTLRGGWGVIRVLDSGRAEDLIRQVEAVQPDVVIIYRDEPAQGGGLPLQLLQSRPDLKVITLGLKNNFVEVYNRRTVWLEHTADLFAVIEDWPRPNAP